MLLDARAWRLHATSACRTWPQATPPLAPSLFHVHGPPDLGAPRGSWRKPPSSDPAWADVMLGRPDPFTSPPSGGRAIGTAIDVERQTDEFLIDTPAGAWADTVRTRDVATGEEVIVDTGAMSADAAFFLRIPVTSQPQSRDSLVRMGVS